MHEVRRSLDHATHFLRAENGRQLSWRFGKRKVVEVHVAAFEHLLEEEAQCRHPHLHRPWIEFPLLQQIPLEALNMCRSQSIRWFTEILRELFDGEDVAANCGRGIVATLEFFQHLLS